MADNPSVHAATFEAVNNRSRPGSIERVRTWIALRTRMFDQKQSVLAFDPSDDRQAIQRIYVINLDRQPDRWEKVRDELARLSDASGMTLTAMTRRVPAVDARQIPADPDSALLEPAFSLADQLRVGPISVLGNRRDAEDRQIQMSRQEIAVALSHIAVWKRIAASAEPYSLVLEDDVYFRRGFSKTADAAWSELQSRVQPHHPPDLVYMSFQEANEGPPRPRVRGELNRPHRGMWHMSGYVLSRGGAKKLLALLPVRGPVDLWVNLQFSTLDVLATRRSVIEQRSDIPSTNYYSVLPVLSQLGVLTRERALVMRDSPACGPVFAIGDDGSGLSGLAAALSIVGYRCCSDIDALPSEESAALFGRRRGRLFDAYVNVGTLGPEEFVRLAGLYKDARFIVSVRRDAGAALRHRRHLSSLDPEMVIHFDDQTGDPWGALTRFLRIPYPTAPYPHRVDAGQRELCEREPPNKGRERPGSRQAWDVSPWIVPSRNWRGITTVPTDGANIGAPTEWETWTGEDILTDANWRLRDDTFPSNLALFRPSNCVKGSGGTVSLTLREERTTIRDVTSAAIASVPAYLYGRFSVELRPTNVSGLITGVFLHRNQPRQEIDLEFLGRDTTKALVNVYYNPGNEGALLEYGYRGTPVLIDLGFDAAKAIHRYEIEWTRDEIRWWVDGEVLHERRHWAPTLIPDLPLWFNVNLWQSRSTSLAGRRGRKLPAQTVVSRVHVGVAPVGKATSPAVPLLRSEPEVSRRALIATSEIAE